jgi:thiamine transport system substrate-binding protein
MKIRWFAALVLLLAISGPAAAQEEADTITLVTHDSFNVSETVLNAFQESSGIRVEILRSGDAGTMVNQAILSIGNPLGDVLFGVDNTFLGRALDADIFTPYESPLLDKVDAAFQVDPEHRVTPIDYGDVCLNYDVAYFEVAGVSVPSTLEELAQREYADLLAVQNPATSSPGLAFLLTTIAHFGTEGDYTYLNYWQDLVTNGVYIADDWSDAYYGQFSGSTGSEGSRPLVVSYASSPPAEVFFAETPTDTAPTAAIVADGMCFRQIEFAGILKGTDQPEAAQQFIDFLVSIPFQEDVPLQMFVFPVNSDATLPEVFVTHAQVPEQPVMMGIDEINANRETWIQEWTETVLR